MEEYEKVVRKLSFWLSLTMMASGVMVIAVGSGNAKWSIATYFAAIAIFSFLLAKLK